MGLEISIFMEIKTIQSDKKIKNENNYSVIEHQLLVPYNQIAKP
jgi:hypothetical protein